MVRKKTLFNSVNLIYIAVLLISILAILPLLSIIANSLHYNLNFSTFIFNDILRYIINSLNILFYVIFFTCVFGVVSAYLVSFFDFLGSRFFKYALILSFAIPPYIYGYSLSSFFENFGTGYSLIKFFSHAANPNSYLPNFSPMINVIISLSFTLYGYVFILSKTSFSNQSQNLLDLGKSLGFSPLQRFYKIVLPSARPGIIVGLSLVAMETLSDFGTVSYFGISTFTTGIYNSWFIFDDLHTSNFLSLILLGFVLIFLIVEKLSRKTSKFHKLSNDAIVKKKKLNGITGFFAFLFCFLLFLFSFLFPFSQMLFWSFKFPEYYENLNLFNLNLNTFFLIFCTSSLLILFSFISNFGNRNIKSKFLNLVSNLSISGYAIPGIIISVSIITFISFLNNYLGINIKTVLIGSFIGLIFGYFFRFYSISYNGIKSNYIKINYSIDESAYLMGYNKFDTFSKIHWPIMRNNIFFIFILISLEIIKELPITLILRPFNFETFSTKAYNFASQDLIEAAAIPSIFLIFWASIFILISFKYFFQNDK